MISIHLRLVLGLLASFMLQVSAASPECDKDGIVLQVLGSGGPELDDQRASSGYLVWQHGKARILIDIGPGSLQQYELSGALLPDLEVILLTHLHVDHSADLPALIKGSFFTARDTDLPVYGPSGSELFPSTSDFVQTLFALPGGAFRYLDSFLDGYAAYHLLPHDVDVGGDQPLMVLDEDDYRISAVAVQHGPIPALAWRIDIGGKSIVISGDMNGEKQTLPKLATRADLLVAHHAIPEGAQGVERYLHMPPSVIGQIADQAGIQKLVLSHLMTRTLGKEAESTRIIRQHYQGPLVFAHDGECFPVR